MFMLSLCRQTNGETDSQTTVKQYAPDLLMQGNKIPIDPKNYLSYYTKKILKKCILPFTTQKKIYTSEVRIQEIYSRQLKCFQCSQKPVSHNFIQLF